VKWCERHTYTADIARSYEVAIIGGGIAGASLAYFLSQRGVTDVVLLERESAPGYHATGRSAATLCSFDFSPTLRALKHIGGAFLRQPPDGFSETPVFDQTGVLLLFAGDTWIAAQALAAVLTTAGLEQVELWSTETVCERFAVLSPATIDGAVWVPHDGRIDVDVLLSAYLRHARRSGVELRTDTEVIDLLCENGRCSGVVTSTETIEARWVVNAAGAWVGDIGRRAGASTIAFEPRRRTMITFEGPANTDTARWPLVCNETELVYFAPSGGDLLASPMDAEPCAPCDARPDELGIALVIDKLSRLAPTLTPRGLHSKWAGLRTFSPDGDLVVGEDPRLPGFFWLAGQGGAGIETSPAVGAIAADLIIDGATDRFEAARLSPRRFA